ncbi:beta-secretase 1-like isoform X1 [Dreissena polymorpha]|nr:beta-secretase 1-like isoform X1 [Dreissena polymorpha]
MEQAIMWNTQSTGSWLTIILLLLELIFSVVFAELFQVKKHARLRKEINTAPFQYESQIGNLVGKVGEGYYLEVLIGTQPQKLNLLIDTGSSNLAVACAKDDSIDRYFQTNLSSTYGSLGVKVSVPYTVGSWSGLLGHDLITMTTVPNSTVTANIACIQRSSSFYINGSDWQGILGLAYADIARPDSHVDPWFDTLVSQRGFNNVFGVQLCGRGYKTPNPEKLTGGSIVFGGVAASLYHGSLYSTPVNKEWYYEVILVDVKVNGRSLAMDCKEYNFGKTIVDTGTTNLRLPTRVFNKLVGSMKDQVTVTELLFPGFWAGLDNLCWREGYTPYHLFPNVSLVLPVNTTAAFGVIVTPQQYLRPVGEENDDKPENDCFKLAISSFDSGTVLGAIVMEGYYVVFDRHNRQVLWAESTCGYVDTKSRPSIDSSIIYAGDYNDCAYKKPETRDLTLTIIGYVMAGICGLCLVPLLVLTFQWQCRRVKCRKSSRRGSHSDVNDLMNDS